jgi:voltage-gated potassium channel Kch
VSDARPRIRLTLSPEAERYVRRDALVEVRRMAARGALPFAPVELATVLFALLHDPDAETKERARQSLEGLPHGITAAVLSGPAHPAVLSHLAQVHQGDATLMETLALNAAADDQTVALLAALPHKRVVDIVSNNQQRMLRCPEIVEALGSNPLTGRAVIDRILSFLGLAKPGAEVPDEGADEASAPAQEITDAEAEAALRAILGDDVSEFAADLVEEGAELDEAAQGNLYALLQTLTVFQKIKLARTGNKEARALLIRETNKIVAAAVVRSPKITEPEVLGFAKSRSVSDEVLRLISANRDWTKSYQIKLALSGNPKCPQPVAMRFVNYLQEKDLLGLMKSKDVPSVISTHARRLLTKKGKI